MSSAERLVGHELVVIPHQDEGVETVSAFASDARFKDLPQDIQELFALIGPETLEKIVPKPEETPEEARARVLAEFFAPEKDPYPETHRERLRFIAGMESEERRDLFAEELIRVIIRNSASIRTFNRATPTEFPERVRDFIDLIWEQREDPREETCRIYNEGYYEECLRAREVLVQKLQGARKALVDATHVLNHGPARGKRAQGVFTHETRLRIELEIQEADRALSDFDWQHRDQTHSYPRLRDLEVARDEERTNTSMLATVARFYDGTEFSVLMGEVFDRVYLSKERRTLRAAERSPGSYGAVLLGEARAKIDGVHACIEAWEQAHGSDASCENIYDPRQVERQVKQIEYVISLLKSYYFGRHEKERAEEDGDIERASAMEDRMEGALANLRPALRFLRRTTNKIDGISPEK